MKGDRNLANSVSPPEGCANAGDLEPPPTHPGEGYLNPVYGISLGISLTYESDSAGL